MISRTRVLGLAAVALGLALFGPSPRVGAQAIGFGNNNGFGGQNGFGGGFGNNNQNGFGGGFGNNNGFGGGFLNAGPGQAGGGGGGFAPHSGFPIYAANPYNGAFSNNPPQTYNNLGGLSAAIGGTVNGRQGAAGGMPLRRRRR